MSLMERDEEQLEEYRSIVEAVMEELDYEDLDKDAKKDLYVDMTSEYRLFEDWSDDEDVDWVHADRMLESSFEKAQKLYNMEDINLEDLEFEYV